MDVPDDLTDEEIEDFTRDHLGELDVDQLEWCYDLEDDIMIVDKMQ